MVDRQIGKVKWFDKKKGFGIITHTSGDIFIHHSEIQLSNKNVRACLFEDEDVEFEIFSDNKNKANARNLTGISNKLLLCEKRYQPIRPDREKKYRKPKNTETFEPSHAPPDMRLVIAKAGLEVYNREHTSRDVVMVNDLFCDQDDMEFYKNLRREIKESGLEDKDLWKSWHGDTHWIADDKKNWKKSCPTFNLVLEKLQKYFKMDIKATRLNLYSDSSEWKPFHHDAAAVKPDKAKTQNLTVAVSFGAERDAAFEHAKTKTVISLPQPNGSIYTFGKDVNIMWKHGILQVPPEKENNKGRISIIAWGWHEQPEM